MKTLSIALLAMLSFNCLAQATFGTIPKAGLRNGNLPIGTYIFHKVEFVEGQPMGEGHQPNPRKPVSLKVLSISQKKNPQYTRNNGRSFDTSGPSTDIATSVEVEISDNKNSVKCTISSKSVDDGGSDIMGYDRDHLGCWTENRKESYQILLTDYGLNRVDPSTAHVELVVRRQYKGVLGKVKSQTYSAEIKAE